MLPDVTLRVQKRPVPIDYEVSAPPLIGVGLLSLIVLLCLVGLGVVALLFGVLAGQLG